MNFKYVFKRLFQRARLFLSCQVFKEIGGQHLYFSIIKKKKKEWEQIENCRKRKLKHLQTEQKERPQGVMKGHSRKKEKGNQNDSEIFTWYRNRMW